MNKKGVSLLPSPPPPRPALFLSKPFPGVIFIHSPLFAACLTDTNLPQINSNTLISNCAFYLRSICETLHEPALSINEFVQCFLKIRCGGLWSNSVTRCKAVLSGGRLAVSPKPIPGGGFGCFRASEFSDLAVPWTKVVFTWHCTREFAALNWQWVDGLFMICRVCEFSFSQKGTVRSVPTCPGMLTYSSFLHVPVPTC